MPRLIDIVDLREAQLAQATRGLDLVDGLTHGQLDGGLLDGLPRGHTLGQCLGITHHPAQHRAGIPLVEHLGAQDAVGRVHLAILDVALISAGEDECLTLVGELHQVVIDIARLVQVVGHDEVGLLAAWQAREQHRRGRSGQSVDDHRAAPSAVQQLAQCLLPCRPAKQVTQLLDFH